MEYHNSLLNFSAEKSPKQVGEIDATVIDALGRRVNPHTGYVWTVTSVTATFNAAISSGYLPDCKLHGVVRITNKAWPARDHRGSPDGHDRLVWIGRRVGAVSGRGILAGLHSRDGPRHLARRKNRVGDAMRHEPAAPEQGAGSPRVMRCDSAQSTSIMFCEAAAQCPHDRRFLPRLATYFDKKQLDEITHQAMARGEKAIYPRAEAPDQNQAVLGGSQPAL